MSKNEMIKRIEYLRELEDMEAEIKAEAEAIRQSESRDGRQRN